MPSRTAVGKPPTRAAITGMPHAWASIATNPKDSLYEGTAHKVADWNHSTNSARLVGGTNFTTSDTPKFVANSTSESG